MEFSEPDMAIANFWTTLACWSPEKEDTLPLVHLHANSYHTIDQSMVAIHAALQPSSSSTQQRGRLPRSRIPPSSELIRGELPNRLSCSAVVSRQSQARCLPNGDLS